MRNTENKGVTASINDIIEASKSQQKQAKDGLQTIKEELATVIELMGPSTPHLVSTSSAVEHDGSSISASIISSIVEVKKLNKKDSRPVSTDTPRDISEMSALPIDISETTDAERADVRLGHDVEMCPCRHYYNAVNTLSQNASVKASQPNVQSFGKMLGTKSNKERGLSFLNLLKFRKQERELSKEPLDLYKINILQASDHNVPKKLTFDLIDNIPRPDMNTVATNTSKHRIDSPFYYPQMHYSKQTLVPSPNLSQLDPRTIPPQSARQNLPTEKPTRVDVYYFDHGNACYLKTTDVVPMLTADVVAEKTETYTAKFWAEIFGTIHIFFAFLTTFLLQFLRFVLQSLVRPLTIGLLQLTSDYFFKPCLTVCFNAVIQPPAIFMYNVFTSLRDLCDPIAEGIGYFLREIANICRSIRLVEVKNNRQISRTPLRRQRLRRKK